MRKLQSSIEGGVARFAESHWTTYVFYSIPSYSPLALSKNVRRDKRMTEISSRKRGISHSDYTFISTILIYTYISYRIDRKD